MTIANKRNQNTQNLNKSVWLKSLLKMFTLEASTTIVGNEFHISQTRLTKNTYFCIHSRLTLEQFMSVTPCYTILIEYKIGCAMDSDIVMNNLITSYKIIL